MKPHVFALTWVASLVMVCVVSQVAFAEDKCDALRPTPPQNLSQEIVGKIDAKINGFTGRLLNMGGNLDGTYRETANDVLKEYPSADRLYIWSRLIYINCAVTMQSSLSDQEKANRIDNLIRQIGQLPPQIGSDNTLYSVPVPPSMGSGNTIIGPTDRNGNTIIPGGTAIGNGACADSTSVALGAHANAGACAQKK
jgi:hypothetical protein